MARTTFKVQENPLGDDVFGWAVMSAEIEPRTQSTPAWSPVSLHRTEIDAELEARRLTFGAGLEEDADDDGEEDAA
jgi:hypothetical protein